MIAFAIIGLHAASTHPETCSDEIEQLAATMVHKEPAYGLFQRARDLKLAQIHPDVDHALSQFRKIDKIASSGVARSRVD